MGAAWTAAAGDHRIAPRVVIVGQLFPRANRAPRADPDHTILDLDPAVRSAGVIDEARDVAADTGVDDPAAVQRETPDAALLQVLPLAREALLMCDLLARIVDDPSVLRNRRRRVHAPAR